MRRLLVLATLTFALRAYAQPMFVPLGDLPGGEFYSEARAVSADGSVVVGESRDASGYSQAFRWTASGGMLGLGIHGSGVGVSGDGSVVTGGLAYMFRWTQQGGIQDIGGTVAYGISSDGSKIIGASHLWSSTAGLQPFVGGLAISGNGLVVVGETYPSQASRCIIGASCTNLGNFAANSTGHSQANAASYDGSTVVGYGLLGLERAFRWTAADGLVALDAEPPPASYSIASGVSGDGSVVVGQRNYFVEQPNTSSIEAFIWTPADGMRGLRDVLVTDYGLDLTGWTLDDARAVSTDGRAIVGKGFNPDGNVEAWLFLLPGCADGKDDDGDGLIDFDGGAAANHGVPLGSADPGCKDGSPVSIENPQCQDGLDNDGDGKIDFDGGASANHGTPLGTVDADCNSIPSGKRERLACGLGAELALVLPLIALAASRRRRAG